MLLLFTIFFCWTTSWALDTDTFLRLVDTPITLEEPVYVCLDESTFNCNTVNFAKAIFKTKTWTLRILGDGDLKMLRDSGISSIIIDTSKAPDKLSAVLETINYDNLGVDSTVIVILSGIEDLDGIKIKVRLNQNIFFLDETTGKLFERYAINNVETSSEIGDYRPSWGRDKVKFQLYDRKWQPNIGLRRKNFQGQHLVCMTAHDPPYASILPGFKENATFYENNGTYHVTDYHGPGMFFDIFQELSRDLNFTYDLYTREDEVWGNVDLESNVTTGIVHNIAHGTAEIGVTDFAVIWPRTTVLDFLPKITLALPAIFIKSQQPESVTWTLLLDPFALELWLIIVLVAIGIATLLFISNGGIEKIRTSFIKGFQNYLGWFWIALSANASGKPAGPPPNNNTANRVVIFCCLLAGTIVWMAFRASITSELSVKEIVYPFNDMKSLLETDFRLNTYTKGAASAELFIQAPKGTIYNKIYENNMDPDDSFGDVPTGLNKVINRYHNAFFEDIQLTLGRNEFHCKLTPVWRSTIPFYELSMPMKKRSVYSPAMSWKVLQMRKSGLIRRLRSQYLKDKPPDCSPIREIAEPLGIKKLASLFLIMAVGILAALSMFFFEIIFPEKQKPTRVLKSEAAKILFSTDMLIRKTAAQLLEIIKNCPKEQFEIIHKLHLQEELMQMLENRG